MKIRFKIIIVVLVLLISTCGLYEFVTADRYGYWSKEFQPNLTAALNQENFRLVDVSEITPEEVPKSKVKITRLFFQRTLGIVDSKRQYAKQYTLTSEEDSCQIVCRTLFSGDHVMAISVETNKSGPGDDIKNVLTGLFSPYEIEWVIK